MVIRKAIDGLSHSVDSSNTATNTLNKRLFILNIVLAVVAVGTFAVAVLELGQ